MHALNVGSQRLVESASNLAHVGLVLGREGWRAAIKPNLERVILSCRESEVEKAREMETNRAEMEGEE